MNGFAIAFSILSCIFALWAFAGLLCPKEGIFFALPELQTRSNAFCFPMRIALVFAIAAAGIMAESEGLTFWAWLIGGIMFWRAMRHREILVYGTPLY